MLCRIGSVYAGKEMVYQIWECSILYEMSHRAELYSAFKGKLYRAGDGHGLLRGLPCN